LYVGEQPSELKDLTSVEEAMISLCRAKFMMVQLRSISGDDNDFSNDSNSTVPDVKGNGIAQKGVPGVARIDETRNDGQEKTITQQKGDEDEVQEQYSSDTVDDVDVEMEDLDGKENNEKTTPGKSTCRSVWFGF
jgi:hypothetical protein